jgi:hypothetical protein
LELSLNQALKRFPSIFERPETVIGAALALDIVGGCRIVTASLLNGGGFLSEKLLKKLWWRRLATRDRHQPFERLT